mmetsp:Transcript_95824/g.243573  ORF Transcript_95824/g.243573 Transcript_95824/m.243573 type:complete len:230 (-) Transcript_95824:15-704(-)
MPLFNQCKLSCTLGPSPMIFPCKMFACRSLCWSSLKINMRTMVSKVACTHHFPRRNHLFQNLSSNRSQVRLLLQRPKNHAASSANVRKGTNITILSVGVPKKASLSKRRVTLSMNLGRGLGEDRAKKGATYCLGPAGLSGSTAPAPSKPASPPLPAFLPRRPRLSSTSPGLPYLRKTLPTVRVGSPTILTQSSATLETSQATPSTVLPNPMVALPTPPRTAPATRKMPA